MLQRSIKYATGLLGVRPGEESLFGLLLLGNLLIGAARVFCWTAGNAIFVDRLGSENQPYLYLIASILLPALAAGYLRAQNRLQFRTLCTAAFSFQIVFLVALRLLLSTTDSRIVWFLTGVSFDIVMFLTGVIFWALAGRLCDLRQSKRLFPMIGTGEWIMTVIIGFATPVIVGWFGTTNLFWLSAASLGGALMVLLYITSTFAVGTESAASDPDEPKAATAKGSILRNPYVVGVLTETALATLVVLFLENALYGLLEQRYPNEDELAKFFGLFWGWVGVVILVGRAVLTRRLLESYGIRLGMLLLPFVTLAGALIFVGVGSIAGVGTAVAFWILTLMQFADAWLRNDMYESSCLILYQPLPSGQRSIVQATSEGVIGPIMTGLSGALLLAVKFGLGFGPLGIIATLPVIIVPWIVVAWVLTKRYPQVLSAAIAGHRFDAVTLSLSDNTSRELLRTKLESPRTTEVLYALALLDSASPQGHIDASDLARLLEHAEPDVRREALGVIARHNLRDLVSAVRASARRDAAANVRAQAILTLAKLEEIDAIDDLSPCLTEQDPEIRVAAIVGLMRFVGLEGIVLAARHFEALRLSSNPAERLLAARILGEVGIAGFYRPLLPLLKDQARDVRSEALIAAGKLKSPRLWPQVLTALDSPGLQSAAVAALIEGGEEIVPLLEAAFDQNAANPEHQVRLLRVFQQIRSDQVLRFLERHLDATHPEVYSRVLGALNYRRYQAHSADAGRVIAKIKDEARHTAWLLDVQRAIGSGADHELLQDALEIQRRQDRDRVFLLLSFVYDTRAMLDARDNLEHLSTERRAYAMEIVDSMIALELKPFVVPLLDEMSIDDRSRKLHAASGSAPAERSVDQHLADIIGGADHRRTDWLITCAIFSAGRLRSRECLKPVAAAAGQHREPLVRHTALWALSQIDPADYRQKIADLPKDDLGLQSAISILERRAQGEQHMLLDIEKLLILKTVPIFTEAPSHVLAQVVGILEEREYAAGESIFQKGDLGTCMYVIVTGKVRVHDGDRELVILGERRVFGELALLDPEPRSASVTAIEPTLLFRIGQSAIFELMANHIEIARGIMRVLCRRIREKN